ncbi:MAG TPA: replication protein, partial [Gemmatimonadaceae bacterium]
MSNRTDDTSFEYEGFSNPNGTIVPDDVFDVLMPRLADAELRILLYIIRRTFGFKKNSDDISLRQMVEGITTRDGRVLDSGTGLSKPTVARGLAGLREKRIIVATRNRSVERGNEATSYRLRF